MLDDQEEGENDGESDQGCWPAAHKHGCHRQAAAEQTQPFVVILRHYGSFELKRNQIDSLLLNSRFRVITDSTYLECRTPSDGLDQINVECRKVNESVRRQVAV